MLRKISLVVPVLALLMLPGIAQAQFEAGNWALTLSGAGQNDQDFDGGAAQLNTSLGYFISKEVELGVRQSLTWSDNVGGDGSAWGGDTRAFADLHFDLDRWQPYVGGFIGFIYGDTVEEDSWVAGPEVGVKYFVNPTTFIDLNGAYAFNLEEGLDEGSFFYSLGLGFRW